MAPEQLERSSTVDTRADIYAVGVVLYEMLMGVIPTDRFVFPSTKSRVSVLYDRVIERALAYDPNERYQSAEEFKADIDCIDRRDRQLSVFYNEQGRARIQEWGGRMEKSNGNDWCWHLLGQAIEYYNDAIKQDDSFQPPNTNLAYVYHLVGAADMAQQFLNRSRDLASPGENWPGRNHKQVERAISDDAYLTGSQVCRPTVPAWFVNKYQRFLSHYEH